MVCTEVLLQCLNSLQHQNQLLLSLYLRLRMQTVVTIVAVILRVFLAKIVHQHLTTTDAGLCIRRRLSQQLTANILLSYRLTLHKLVELLQVLMGIERDTHTLTAITTGTTSLLIVAFQ